MPTHTVVVIGEPGPLWEGLQALLMTIPRVGAVRLFADLSRAFVTYAHDPPTLVLIDHPASPEAAHSALAQIHSRWPQTPSIVLIDGAATHPVAYDGADAVLVEGMPAAKLIATVEWVLSQRATHELLTRPKT